MLREHQGMLWRVINVVAQQHESIVRNSGPEIAEAQEPVIRAQPPQ